MRVEYADVDALRSDRESGRDLRGAVLIGLDLTGPDEDRLLRTALDGALLLGCALTPETARRAEAAGALLFPAVPDLPYEVYRARLYTPAELFAGFDPTDPASYADTPDARIYRHTREQALDPLHALAERLHDHSITSALEDVLTGHPVAVMGGHALVRDTPGYREAVDLGRALGSAGFTVLTGGGPGAMEAVPLGVRLAGTDPSDALSALAAAPRFAAGVDAAVEIGQWLAAGLAVDLPVADTPRTIGIPTWFYGHEPPNPFCELHAKYFANSVREDGLLTVATGGIVYTPGSAGTVQEVFQDYTQNHYGVPAPMVFLGTRFWTEEVPAAPLVRGLAKGRPAEAWITVTDDIAEAVEVLTAYAATL
ncbi:LOG family protein [Actinokineospora soli]|uniref:LOG family protein n=1 Tax=Actinokineospora soli TaxID=1048753 RepID=A0ABW2TXI5_9PSEU